MTIEEILAGVQQLSAEDKTKVFTTLGTAMDTLPKALEDKFLDRKNAKLTEKDNRITELETQVSNFETANKTRAGKELKEFVGQQGRANKVVSALTKDYTRAALEALNENSKLAEDARKSNEEVIKTLLTENKHYTNAAVSQAGVVIIDEGNNKNKDAEPKSAKDLLRQAQQRNKKN